MGKTSTNRGLKLAVGVLTLATVALGYMAISATQQVSYLEVKLVDERISKEKLAGKLHDANNLAKVYQHLAYLNQEIAKKQGEALELMGLEMGTKGDDIAPPAEVPKIDLTPKKSST